MCTSRHPHVSVTQTYKKSWFFVISQKSLGLLAPRLHRYQMQTMILVFASHYNEGRCISNYEAFSYCGESGQKNQAVISNSCFLPLFLTWQRAKYQTPACTVMLRCVRCPRLISCKEHLQVLCLPRVTRSIAQVPSAPHAPSLYTNMCHLLREPQTQGSVDCCPKWKDNRLSLKAKQVNRCN